MGIFPSRSLDPTRMRALVTGASSGIGAELARALARRRTGELVLVARRRNRLETLAAELAREGTDCRVEPVDLADADAVESLVERVPHVDLLANCAGFGSGYPLLERDPRWHCQMVDVNARAVVRLTQAWLGGMVERGRGGVLLVGSLVGWVPMPTMAVYAASKAFVHSFADSLRAEVEGTGVRIHLLAPGPVRSEFYERSRPHTERPADRLFLPAHRVAEEAIDAWLGRRPVWVPGLSSRVLAHSFRLAPDYLIRPLLGLAHRRITRTLRKNERPDRDPPFPPLPPSSHS